MYRRWRREGGANEGQKEAGKRRIAAGEEGIFRGEKRPFRPSSEEVKREERGRKEGEKGQKNCISLRDKAVRFGGELWRESAVLFL